MEKKEYIERGALIEWLKSCKNACIEVCKGLINNIEEYAAENVIATYDDCIGYVESAPAADVVEVVHGEWIESKSTFGGWHYDFPFCDDGFYMRERAKSKPNYCSNCGVKMDGGKK